MLIFNVVSDFLNHLFQAYCLSQASIPCSQISFILKQDKASVFWLEEPLCPGTVKKGDSRQICKGNPKNEVMRRDNGNKSSALTLLHSGEKNKNKEPNSAFICTHHLVVAEQLVSNRNPSTGRKKGSSVIPWLHFQSYKILIKHKSRNDVIQTLQFQLVVAFWLCCSMSWRTGHKPRIKSSVIQLQQIT